MPLPKPCERCGERFQPVTIQGKFCNKCLDKAIADRNKKIRARFKK